MLGSAGFPDQDSSRVEMEVEHVFGFETDVAAEVLSNDALPGGEESLIK